MSLAGARTKPARTAQPTGPWPHRHLLELRGMPPEHLRTVLALSRDYAKLLEKDSAVGSMDELAPIEIPGMDLSCRGKVVANLFFEDSTRTRLSFSVAARRLGAEVLDLTGVGSSVSKGETVGDTAATVVAMGVDAVVVRHRSSGAAHLVARTLEGDAAVSNLPGAEKKHTPGPRGHACSVINAGDGRHEHPTQGLLDILTLAEVFDRWGTFDLSGLTVAIVGDVASSRVARSDIAGMTALGARVICVGPPALVPTSLTTLGCEVSHDLDAILGQIDAVNVLRIQFERHEVKNAQSAENAPKATSSNVIASVREYAELFGITSDRLARMKPQAVVMHPGPMNRGVELTPDVADSNRSMVLRQVTHGVAVRMAVLRLCLAGR